MDFYTKKDQRIYEKTKSFLEKRQENDINKKLKIVEKILKIRDKEERYSFLFDQICDYLDSEFLGKNICGFDCGLCLRRKELMKTNPNKETYLNGCCYSYRKGKLCEYLDPNKGGCQIKNIGCKLFTCYYLRKKGYRYHLKDIYLAKYFFNIRQKFYLENTFFVPKDVVMKGILERS